MLPQASAAPSFGLRWTAHPLSQQHCVFRTGDVMDICRFVEQLLPSSSTFRDSRCRAFCWAHVQSISLESPHLRYSCTVVKTSPYIASSLQMRSPIWPEYGVVSCSSFDGPSQGEGWDEGSGNHLAPQKLSTCDQCTLLEILNCPSHRPSCPDGLTAVLRNIPRSTRVVLRYQDDKGRFRAVRHCKVLVRMDTYISNKQKLTMV